MTYSYYILMKPQQPGSKYRIIRSKIERVSDNHHVESSVVKIKDEIETSGVIHGDSEFNIERQLHDIIDSVRQQFQ